MPQIAMDEAKRKLVEQEAKAFTHSSMAVVEAIGCSTHMVKEMEKVISPETIKNLNRVRKEIMEKWESDDPNTSRSQDAIATALEMGIRHTLRDLLEEV